MNNNPYQAPKAAPENIAKTTDTLFWFAVASVVLYCSLIIGNITISLLRVIYINQYIKSPTEQNLNSLTDFLSNFLPIVMSSFVFSLVGICLIIYLLKIKRYRAPRFYYAILISSFIWGIGVFPTGFVVGVTFFLVCFFKRKEFIKPNIQSNHGYLAPSDRT